VCKEKPIKDPQFNPLVANPNDAPADCLCLLLESKIGVDGMCGTGSLTRQPPDRALLHRRGH